MLKASWVPQADNAGQRSRTARSPEKAKVVSCERLMVPDQWSWFPLPCWVTSEIPFCVLKVGMVLLGNAIHCGEVRFLPGRHYKIFHRQFKMS